MLVTIEKYDIVKGVTYKRQFELDSDCIVFEKDGMTTAIIHGLFKELCILLRDKENVNFISCRVVESISKDFTCYNFDTIKYFCYNDKYFCDSDIKVLVRENDMI